MKINIRHLVLLFLGLFLAKIVIADPFRFKETKAKPSVQPTRISVSQVR